MAITVLAPAGFQQFSTRGAAYTADSKGLITNVALNDLRDLVNADCVVLGYGVVGINNVSATTDPTVSSDNTQDYAPGSIWVNTLPNHSPIPKRGVRSFGFVAIIRYQSCLTQANPAA